MSPKSKNQSPHGTESDMDLEDTKEIVSRIKSRNGGDINISSENK